MAVVAAVDVGATRWRVWNVRLVVCDRCRGEKEHKNKTKKLANGVQKLMKLLTMEAGITGYKALFFSNDREGEERSGGKGARFLSEERNRAQGS